MEKNDQTTLRGSCACSAISYSFFVSNKNEEDKDVHVCYCDTCQKWTGGVLFAIKGGSPENPPVIDNPDQIQVWKSSSWAERAFCKTCGSSVYYRVTAPGPFHNQCFFTAGGLDKNSWKDLKFVKEVYIDNKPAAFCFATGETPRLTLTRAQVNAQFKDS